MYYRLHEITILDEISLAFEVSSPFKVSDYTLLDANTLAKPQNLTNVPLNDFGVILQLCDMSWSLILIATSLLTHLI